jgi:hypothetical protein
MLRVGRSNTAHDPIQRDHEEIRAAHRAGNPVIAGWYADPEAHVLRTTLSLPDLLGP